MVWFDSKLIKWLTPSLEQQGKKTFLSFFLSFFLSSSFYFVPFLNFFSSSFSLVHLSLFSVFVSNTFNWLIVQWSLPALFLLFVCYENKMFAHSAHLFYRRHKLHKLSRIFTFFDQPNHFVKMWNWCHSKLFVFLYWTIVKIGFLPMFCTLYNNIQLYILIYGSLDLYNNI